MTTLPAIITDPRTTKALEIASDAGQFVRCRTADGELVWGVPSQSRDLVRYLVTETTCECEDFRRNGLRRGRIGFHGSHFACKHVRALKILISAWNAQQTPEDPDLVLEQLPSGEFAWLRPEAF
jgi:predicted nucleic acid-binding Zn finger protein